MRTEQTDPLAATRAEQHAQRIAEQTVRGKIYADGTVDLEVTTADIPLAIVAEFAAREERLNGQRRVVLYGPWEIDPAAIRCTDAR